MITKYLNQGRNHWLVLIYIGLFCSSFTPVFTQNIYNLDNSKKYADYLLLSKQYKLAAEEYERLVFLDKDNQEFKVKLLQAYRNSGNLGLAINRVYSLGEKNIFDLPRGLSVEYLSSLVFADSLGKINLFLDKNPNITKRDKAVFKCSSLILGRKYRESDEFCKSKTKQNGLIPIKLKMITKDALGRKLKSPLLAGSLSTIVPGLGKVYTKNYVDGLMSLLFVAGSAWQSYKGFKNNGTKSVSGWIFGGISLGFYIGNIYGSAKAAKRYNKLKYNEINNEVYNFIQYYNF